MSIVPRSLLLTTICTALFACTPSTIKAKRVPASAALNEQQLANIAVNVVVQNESGAAMSGLDVVVTCGTEKADDVTGPSGRAYLEVARASGLALDFEFKSASVNWTDSVSLIPDGVQEVTVYFRVDELGKVLFTRLEY